MTMMDPKTVTMLAGIISGLMSGVLYALKRNYPPSIRGLGMWSLCLLVLFACGVLVSTRGIFPDLVSISLPTLLLWLGMFMAYVGTQQFFGITLRKRYWLAFIGIVGIAQVWFTVLNPDYRARLVLTTSMAATLASVHAAFVLRQGGLTFGRGLTAGVLATMAAIQLLRLSTVSLVPAGAHYFDSDPIHLVYIASFTFAMLLFSVSTLLLASERLHTEFEYQASHDSLTQALTRRRMNDACANELERCHRHGRHMALLLIDLDHFKVVNDTWGHQAGDQVLVNFVKDVQTVLRQPDLLGRLGGEEFLVLLPETTMDEALAVAERIRESCARTRPGPGCTASIGVATNRSDSDTIDSLMARADSAMYRAKARGRNRTESD